MSPSANRPTSLVSSAMIAMAIIANAGIGSAFAATIHVPGDFPTIQEGLDAAEEGDTVLVACGTYEVNGIFPRRGVTLRSETGLADCVTLDGNGLGVVLVCDRLDPPATIEGFTITGGLGIEGGGMIVKYSEVFVRHCNFRENQCNYMGAAVFAFDSAVHFDRCIFSDNVAYGVGGAVYAYRASSSYDGCQFIRNRAIRVQDQISGAGGALFLHFEAPATVENCLFTGNTGHNPGEQSIVGGPLQVHSSIFAWNGPEDSPQFAGALVTCTDIYGNLPGWFANGSTGNFSEDPLFCDPSNDDYHLQTGSPCLPGNHTCNALIGPEEQGCGPVTSVTVHITTDPPGLPLVVDGVAGLSPQTYEWLQYSPHSVAVDSLVPGSATERLRFSSWSNGEASAQEYRVPVEPIPLIAHFEPQYFVGMAGVDGGSVMPESNWFDEGARVAISADPNPGRSFVRWNGIGKGSYSGTENPAFLDVLGPIQQEARFRPDGFEFRISASATDPFVNSAPPANGPRDLYLWMTCSTAGLTAFESGVQGELKPTKFTSLNEALNIGEMDDLFLAVGGCPIGPEANALLGFWTVEDHGGGLCFVPSRRSGIIGAVNCDSFDPYLTIGPRVIGFTSSGGKPCHSGQLACNWKPGANLEFLSHESRELETDAQRPTLARLEPIRPNPFALQTEIQFTVGADHRARIAIYDVAGRRIRVLVDEVVPAGIHSRAWDGKDGEGNLSPSGIYFVRLETPSGVENRKMTLIRDR